MNQRSSSSGFRIGPDDEDIDPDPYGRPGAPRRARSGEDPRIARLRRRLTLISILMPLLVVLMVALAYGILEKRILKVQHADSAELQVLLKSLGELTAGAKSTKESLAEAVRRQDLLKKSVDDRDASMDEAFMVFEKTSRTLRQDMKAVEGKIVPIHEKLKAVEVHLRRIDAEKADTARIAAAEKALADALADLRNSDLAKLGERIDAVGASVAPVRTDLDASRKALSALEEAHARDHAAVRQAVEGAKGELAGLSADYKQLKKDLVDVLSVTIDQKGLSRAIETQEKNVRAEIQGIKRSLESKDRTLSQLQAELGSLEKRVTALGRNRAPLGAPKPGSFIEQNIE
ncbi:hypothetical protein [Desulfococcus sp.]|uniref:hypothetical protein n=1 Tax=Desulfococcus sp. TaxID=2025834 RepID=UPI0035945659